MANLIRKNERRRYARQPLTARLRVLWEDADGQSQVCMADLVSISIEGMKILVGPWARGNPMRLFMRVDYAAAVLRPF